MAQSVDPRTFAASCLCLAVRRAARSVARRYDEAFRDLGITNGQFTILMFVSANRPLTMAQLADELAMDRTTLTAALKPLARDGLVRTASDAGDRRSRVTTLTARGAALLEAAIPRWRQAQADVARDADPNDLKRLRATLHAMT